MFDDDLNQKNGDNRGPKKPAGGFNMPAFTWVAWIAVIAGIAALMISQPHVAPATVTEPEFCGSLTPTIPHATVNYNPQTLPVVQITGTYYKTDKDGTRSTRATTAAEGGVRRAEARR